MYIRSKVMASRGIGIGVPVITVLVAMLWAKAMSQSDCTNVLISMAPCLNYVTGSDSAPSSSCCSQLATVVQSQPRCLCMALGGGAASLGVDINQTLALKLPDACNVQTPPVSKCNAPHGTGTSPADSPEGLPGGSKAVPATSGSSCNGPVMNTPLQLIILFALFMASCASAATMSF